MKTGMDFRGWLGDGAVSAGRIRRSLKVSDQRMAEKMRVAIEQNVERGVAGLPQSFVDFYQVFEEFKRAVILKKSESYARRLLQQLKPFLIHLQKSGLSNLAEELGLIFKHAHENSVAFYKMLLFAGMRDGEARHLQWQDVILTRGSEHIKVRGTESHETKNRRDRMVPLCREAIEILQELYAQRDQSNPFVFTGRKGGHRAHNRNTSVACLERIERETRIRIEKKLSHN